MTVYVLKDNQTGKYIHYSEHGYGYEWVDSIAKATLFTSKEIAENCCYAPCRVVEVRMEEVK